jgi:hypothetical protein
MKLTPIECLMISMVLFRRVVDCYTHRGFLTIQEKTQVIGTILFLTKEFLSSSGILNELGQCSKLRGEFEMPRIQYEDLKHEGADSNNE